MSDNQLRNTQWIGLMATLLILATMFVAIVREPARQVAAAEAQLVVAFDHGAEIYAENCAICHGASGEGLAAYPDLNAAATLPEDELFKTIERGRYGTTMAAYGAEEGGMLTDADINNLVTMIQVSEWDAVYQTVADMNMIPPEIEVAEVSAETLEVAASLEGGEELAAGLTIYAENCAACHGSNAEGTTLAPALNTEDVRTSNDLQRVIEQGVPGTLMAGWDAALTDDETAQVITLIQRWPELDAAGVVIPVIESEPIDMSPEAIALGERLFSITCTSCHGQEGYGTNMAPALNSAIYLHETPDEAIAQIIAMGVPGTVMPAWGGRFSEADINAIVAYLRSKEATAPIISEAR